MPKSEDVRLNMTVSKIVEKKTTSDEGDATVYQLKLKNKDEETSATISVKDDGELLGFRVGAPIVVQLKNPQTTLEVHADEKPKSAPKKK